MRRLHSLLTLAPSLLLCCLASISAHSHSHIHNPDYLDTISASRHQLPQFRYQSGDSRPFLTRWRDRVLQTVWRIAQPSCHLPGTGRKTSASTASPPPSLLSRYGGDLVLRFEIRSADEAQALADAIDVLLLDVWEFTPDWVDIRLSKDVVSRIPGNGLIRSYSDVMSGSIIARPPAALPPACSYTLNARPCPGHIRVLSIFVLSRSILSTSE